MAGPCDQAPQSPNALLYPNANNPDAVAQIVSGIKNINDFPGLTDNDREIIRNRSGAGSVELGAGGDALFQADLARIRAMANNAPLGSTQSALNADNDDDDIGLESDILNSSQVNENIPEPPTLDYKRNMKLELPGPSIFNSAAFYTADKSKWLFNDGLLLCTRVWDGESWLGGAKKVENTTPVPPSWNDPHPNATSSPVSIPHPSNRFITDTFRYFSGKYWVLLDGDGAFSQNLGSRYSLKNPLGDHSVYEDPSSVYRDVLPDITYSRLNALRDESQYFTFHNPSMFIAGPHGDKNKGHVTIMPMDTMLQNLENNLRNEVSELVYNSVTGERLKLSSNAEGGRGIGSISAGDYIKERLKTQTANLRTRPAGFLGTFVRDYIKNTSNAITPYSDLGVTEWKKEVFFLRIPHPVFTRGDVDTDFYWPDYFNGDLLTDHGGSDKTRVDGARANKSSKKNAILFIIPLLNLTIEANHPAITTGDKEKAKEFRDRFKTQINKSSFVSGRKEFKDLIDEMSVSNINCLVNYAAGVTTTGTSWSPIPLRRWFDTVRGHPYKQNNDAGYGYELRGEHAGSFVLPDRDVLKRNEHNFVNYNANPVFPFFDIEEKKVNPFLGKFLGRRLGQTYFFRAPTIGPVTFYDHVTSIERPYISEELEAMNIRPSHYTSINSVYNFYDEIYEKNTAGNLYVKGGPSSLNTDLFEDSNLNQRMASGLAHINLPNLIVRRRRQFVSDVARLPTRFQAFGRFAINYEILTNTQIEDFNYKFTSDEYLAQDDNTSKIVVGGGLKGIISGPTEPFKSPSNVLFFTNPSSEDFKSAYKDRRMLPMFVEIELGTHEVHAFADALKIDDSKNYLDRVFYPFSLHNRITNHSGDYDSELASELYVKEPFDGKKIAKDFSSLTAVKNLGVTEESRAAVGTRLKSNESGADAARIGIQWLDNNPSEGAYKSNWLDTMAASPKGDDGWSREDLERMMQNYGSDTNITLREYVEAYDSMIAKTKPRPLVTKMPFYTFDQHLFKGQKKFPVIVNNITPSDNRREMTSGDKYRPADDKRKFTEAQKTNISTMSLDEWFLYLESGLNSLETGDPSGFEKIISIYSRQSFLSKIRKIIKDNSRTYEQIMNGTPAHSEPIGYKIEKFIVDTGNINYETALEQLVGDATTGIKEAELFKKGKPIQTYYLSLQDDLDLIKYSDSQVKYGISYKYVISTVYVVIGTEYAYKDLMTNDEARQFHAWADVDREFNDISSINEYEAATTSTETHTFTAGQSGADAQLAASGIRSYMPGGSNYRGEEVSFEVDTQHSARIQSLTEILDLTQIGGDPKDTHFHWPFAVFSRPSVKIMEVPTSDKTIAILDKPPTPPDVEIIPFKGIDNKVLFNLNDMTGQFVAKPIILEDDDKIQFTISAYNQAVHPDDINFDLEGTSSNKGFTLLEFKNDDLSKVFEVFRISEPPKSWKDFYNKKIAKIIQQDATAAAFIDNIIPNKKYYYTFRCEDVHGHVSNPSHIYEVELVSEYGAVYLNAKLYEPKEEPRTREKQLRKYIKLKPAFIQKIMNLSEIKTLDQFIWNTRWTPGIANNKVWGKKFKIRIKSKSTGKELDLNLKFNKIFNKIDGDGILQKYD